MDDSRSMKQKEYMMDDSRSMKQKEYMMDNSEEYEVEGVYDG